MKRLATNPDKDVESRIALAVNTPMPETIMMYVQPDEGYEAGDCRTIYGFNPEEDTVYLDGTMHKDHRYAIEEGSAEVIFFNLPEYIEERRISDHRKNGKPTCKLVVLGGEVLPVPVRTAPVGPNVGGNCKVITHPSTILFEMVPKLKVSRSKPVEKNPNQYRLPLYEDDVKPQNKSA